MKMGLPSLYWDFFFIDTPYWSTSFNSDGIIWARTVADYFKKSRIQLKFLIVKLRDEANHHAT